MEDIGTLYKVRVGFHDEGDVDWYQSYLQAPTWFIEQVTRILIFNSLPASGKFCRLLIIFANNLDPDQDQQNVTPDPNPNCLTL